jgi:murein DD-endopeptidase MepM/ murein hydrolase activator NlpD
MKRYALLLLVVALGLSAAALARPDFPPQVALQVLDAPIPARVDGRMVLVYELLLTNHESEPLTVKQIAVSAADGQALAAFEGEALERMVQAVGPRKGGTTLGSGQQAIAFLWIPIGKVPHVLLHRVGFGLSDGSTRAVSGGVTKVESHAMPVIGRFTDRGGRWLAVNGPSNVSGHRRALLVINGRPWISQRFAIDWVIADDHDKTYRGDPSKNASYYCYGAKVLAVDDGRVEAVLDGVAENVPNEGTRATPITLETVGGNYVALRLSKNRYAMYAHLQPGRILVRPGQSVRKGQLLGYVGNSGNSTEPHLHLHVGTTPAWLAADGVPYVFASFVDGRGRSHRHDLPAEDEAITKFAE